jgi:dTDP-4-amino-4,6-dideoxygalactose transaminase
MDKIYEIAKNKNITVIEDACHALGAKFKGSKIGSGKFSDMAVLSFHAVKHITTGEGGMVLTNNPNLYARLLLFRTHGITRDLRYLKRNYAPWYYQMRYLGYNFRLTDFQCALGVSQLKKINDFLRRRREISDIYNKAFSQIKEIKLIKQEPFAEPAHHLYVIRLNLNLLRTSKENIYHAYKQAGILLNVHYIPVYYQPYYRKLGYKKGLCPKAEKYYEEAFTLPLYPKMSVSDVKKVVRVTKDILQKFKK